MSINQIYRDGFASMDDKNQQLRYLLILLFTFALPFPIFYSSILLVCFMVLTAFNLEFKRFKQLPKKFWLFQLVYVLGLLGYYQSFHRNEASFLLERQLTILLFPIVLPLAININRKMLEGVLLTISLACVTAIVFLILKMNYLIFSVMHMPFSQVLSSGAFFNHGFSKPINIHAGYLSLYVALSIIYLLSLYHSQDRRSGKILLVVMIGILGIGMLFLASRNVMLALIFILLLIYPFYHVANKLRFYVVFLSLIAIIVLSFQTIPYLKERFSVQLVSDIKSLQNGKVVSYSATEPRIERWKCAVTLIKKSPLFGYGTGDEIKMLKTEYMNQGLFISYLEEFNAHNQYLSYLLKNGLIGLIIFLGIFYLYLRLAYEDKNFVYLSFLVLLLIGFYTENILDANKGIFFFALFNTLMGLVSVAKSGKENDKTAVV